MVISQSGKSQEISKKDTLMSHTQPDVFGPSVNSVDELQTEGDKWVTLHPTVLLPSIPDFESIQTPHRCAR
jgi:hypothetical protein